MSKKCEKYTTVTQPMLPYGGVIGAEQQQSRRQAAQKGVLHSVGSWSSNQQGLSTDPLLLSPKRPRSPTPLEYVTNNESMKGVEPDWSKWVCHERTPRESGCATREVKEVESG